MAAQPLAESDYAVLTIDGRKREFIPVSKATMRQMLESGGHLAPGREAVMNGPGFMPVPDDANHIIQPCFECKRNITTSFSTEMPGYRYVVCGQIRMGDLLRQCCVYFICGECGRENHRDHRIVCVGDSSPRVEYVKCDPDCKGECLTAAYYRDPATKSTTA